MRLWGNDAFCVGKVNTFRSMSWRYRVVASSDILAPISMTLAAVFGHSYGMFGHLLPWVAGLMWVLYFAVLSVLVRGYLAEKRGVKPADMEHRDIKTEKWNLFLWLFLVVVMGLPLAFDRRPANADWGSFAMFIGAFFIQLSDYAYLVFLNRSGSAPVPPSLDASSAESPLV
jgi:hypothetical protein